LTENRTPEFAIRVRVTALPAPGEFDEFDLRHFRVGGVFLVAARLGWMLIISGCAEIVDDSPARAEAADFSRSRGPKRK